MGEEAQVGELGVEAHKGREEGDGGDHEECDAEGSWGHLEEDGGCK